MLPRIRVIGCCAGHGEISPFLVHKPLHIKKRSEDFGSNLVQESKSSHPRLQRILFRTFPYHLTVCYIPGLTNQLPDCLSQLGGQKVTIKLPKLHLYQITKQLSIRSDSLNQLRLATQKDDECVLLKHTITQGWPCTIKEVPNVLQPYWTFHKELTVEDGLVLKGTRIVIPNKKHEAVLQLIHEGHLGLSK